MKENNYIKAFQLAVIIASSLLIISLLIAWIISGPGQKWRHVQDEYLDHWSEISDSIGDMSYTVQGKGLHQYRVDEMDRVDRCISCHLGVENPYMEGAPQPMTYHPGAFLKDHPVEKYGCTICHGGQGRAMNAEDAHGIHPDAHWDSPILLQPYIQSSCGQCHLSIFDENEAFTGAEVFLQGHEIFKREGCIGCHKARGVGGIVGPDLTEQGEKTTHDYDFSNIKAEQTISSWLKEHFKDPEMVSPGSQMLKIDLPEEDLDALTTFVLGLAKPDIAFEYFSIEALNEFKGNRKDIKPEELFSMACSGCHGKEGAGKNYEEYKSGAPAIRNNTFLRVVSQDYIEFTLLKGRSTRDMASWMSEISGLRENELVHLVGYIRSAEPSHAKPFKGVNMMLAKTEKGKALFQQHCASCHGKNAEGEVAIALNRKDLLKNADNEYLYQTLVEGRENATMPSWGNLNSGDLYDLVKYLRSFQSYDPNNIYLSYTQADAEAGKLKYHFMCSRCHGDVGQGQTGPAILNEDFITLASDSYLYNTIASGREHTAMFGWSKDVYNAERLGKDDIGNIISFMREDVKKRPDYIYAGANPGNKEEGGALFIKHCAECHGQEGEGKKAPALNNQELLSAASNGYLMATITLGREGTEMPEWGRETEEHLALSGKERQDIVAWIRGWERIRIGF